MCRLEVEVEGFSFRDLGFRVEGRSFKGLGLPAEFRG